jgi:hypothetical protein
MNYKRDVEMFDFEPDGDIALRMAIEQIHRETPRFLFRARSRASGGDPRLNTTEAIIPLAFLRGTGPGSIHDMSRHELMEAAEAHIAQLKRSFQTVFSSWTQSLPFALDYAEKVLAPEEAYISCIDTTKLPRYNIIFFTQTLQQKVACRSVHRVSCCNFEYLAFGPVRGAGYTSVQRKDLFQEGRNVEEFFEADHIRSYPFRQCPPLIISPYQADDQTDQAPDCVIQLVGRAWQIAQLFGPTFQAAPLIHLVTARRQTARAYRMIKTALMSLDLPGDWLTDKRLARERCETGGVPETDRAVVLLQVLIEAARDRSTHGLTTTKHLTFDDGFSNLEWWRGYRLSFYLEPKEFAEFDRLSDGQKEKTRRAVKQLYIDGEGLREDSVYVHSGWNLKKWRG